MIQDIFTNHRYLTCHANTETAMKQKDMSIPELFKDSKELFDRFADACPKSMQLTCKPDLERLEKAMSELGSKQRRSEEAYFDREPTDEQKWSDRIQEIKKEGADKLVYHMVADPYQELAIVYQMALDGMADCDIGMYVSNKVKRLVEQRAIPFCNPQCD